MDEKLFKRIAEDIEQIWQMGGLSDGLYYDYALTCTKAYLDAKNSSQSAKQSHGVDGKWCPCPFEGEFCEYNGIVGGCCHPDRHSC